MDQDMNENTNTENALQQVEREVNNGEQNAQRPGHIPEKFWDSKNKTVRLDALIKSYLELEKRFSKLVHETAAACRKWYVCKARRAKKRNLPKIAG